MTANMPNTRRSSSGFRAGTMRSVNRALIEQTIRDRAPISRGQLCRLTSLSMPTVSAITALLISDGLVREQPPGLGPGLSPGRPAKMLVPNPRVATIGCDMSVSGEVRLGAVGPVGEVLNTRRYSVDSHLNPVAAARLVENYVLELVRDGVVDRIEAVGVGAPGATQIETGLIQWAPALGWRDVAFGPMLEQILGLPVIIDNDVNLALLAEARKGSAIGCREVLLVSFADGMGGALWLEGSIYRGRGGAGEVGYMVAGAPSRGFSYRSFGWAEANVHDLLERECRRRGIRTDESELRSARLASDLAGGGRTMRLSADAREEMLELVVSLVASACALLDVEAVILRGWIKLVGTSFLGEMRRRLEMLLADPPRILTLSVINDEAVLLGAAFAAQDTLHWPPRTHLDGVARVVETGPVELSRTLEEGAEASMLNQQLAARGSTFSAP